MNYHKYLTSLLTALCLNCSTLALAEGDDEWRYEFTPYFFAAGLKGQSGPSVAVADVDMSFGDIWDTLDIGAMAFFEAGKGKWFYVVEGLYFEISDEAAKSFTGPLGNVTLSGELELTTALSMIQTSGGYRLVDGKTKFDVIGALRYVRVEVDLKITTATPGIILPSGSIEANIDEGWIDYVVGARVLHSFADDWSFFGYADVGAGGSDLTYQMMTGVNWAFKKDYTAKAGYRILDWDYDKDGFVWDIRSYGIYTGLGIKF